MALAQVLGDRFAQVLGDRLRSRQGAPTQSSQLSRPASGGLPPGRCPAHADSHGTALCGPCMRAQQERLRAHYAASLAAAREWRGERASIVSASS
jgi:hypothetical protein